MIQFFAENVDIPEIDTEKINEWIKQISHFYGKKPGNINYVFCNNEQILDLNKKFLQHDYFTDIITFDYGIDNLISGDIFISLNTVSSNANDLGIDFKDELHRVIIHGVLHLCGQDDKTEASQKEMRRKEDEALEQLKRLDN